MSRCLLDKYTGGQIDDVKQVKDFWNSMVRLNAYRASR